MKDMDEPHKIKKKLEVSLFLSISDCSVEARLLEAEIALHSFYPLPAVLFNSRILRMENFPNRIKQKRNAAGIP